jgi:hypothetical protein
VSFFGVVRETARPCRPSGCEREAERTAPSARIPSSVRASSTVSAVVQYSRVDVHLELAAVADRDTVTVADLRGEGRDDDVVLTELDVLLLEDIRHGGPEDVDRAGPAVDRDLHGLVVEGHAHRSGGHDERGDTLGGGTKGT